MKRTFLLLGFLFLTNLVWAEGIVIIGVNSDAPNDVAFVATTTIPAGTIIYFSDKEWTGTGFNTGEGFLEYTAPAGGLSPGTVVTVSMSAASVGSVTEIGSFDPANGNDPIYAYLGTDENTPTSFCSVFGDVALSAAENPTSEPEGANAVIISPLDSDRDNWEYICTRSFSSVDDFIAAVTDPNNYNFTDGGGNQAITFDTTPFDFNAGFSYEAVVDCDDNGGTQAGFGEMYVHISNIVNNDPANTIDFSSNVGSTSASFAAGASSGTILITGITPADFGSLITLTATNDCFSADIEIPIPICGFDVDTGGDGNIEDDVSNGVFCTSQNGETAPGILAQVISGNPILANNNITSSYTYVLVDNTNGDAIVATNMTGVFDATDGVANMNDYTIYAFYVSDAEQALFDTELGNLSTIAAGDAILTGTGAFMNLCYSFCCSGTFMPNCCTADAGDLATATPTSDFIICEGFDLLDDAMSSAEFTNTYTATDEVDPNVNDPGDYETAFITTDASGNIVESNTSGDFDFSNDAVYTGGNTYSICVLNYKVDNTPPTVLAYLAGLPATTTAAIIADDNDTSSGGTGTGAFCLDLTCIDASGSPITVTILDEPDVDNQTVMACSEVASGLTLGASTNTTGAATYNITNIDQGGLTASAGSPATGNNLLNSEIANDAYTNTTSADVDVVYTIVPVSADGCEGEPFTVTFTVKPEPVGMDPAPMTCSDVPLNLALQSTIDNGLTGVTFSWTSTNNTNVTGETAAATTPNITDNLTNISGTDQIVTYTITPTSQDGCVGNPYDINITVKPEPVGSDPTPSLCSDEPLNINLQSLITNSMTGVTFSWTSVDNPNVTGETTASTASSITDNLTNVSGSMQIVVYTVTPTSSTADGACVGDDFTVTVTLDSEPVVDNQTSTNCSGSAIGVTLGSSTNTTAATTYNITNVTVATGLTGTGTSGNGLLASAIAGDIFMNPTTGPLDVVYTVVPVSAGLCEGNEFTVTVTIDPMVMVDLSTVATDLCYKSAADIIDLTGDFISGSTDTGTWTTSGDGTFNNGSTHPATTTYTTGAGDRSKATVTLTLTADSGNTCPSDSDNVTIIVRDVTCTNNSFFGGNN